jgi:hypothetical protein
MSLLLGFKPLDQTTVFLSALLMFGEELRSSFDSFPIGKGAVTSKDHNMAELKATIVVKIMQEKLMSVYQIAFKNCLEAHERQKQLHYKCRKNRNFQVGSFVWREKHN